ncbi:serine/threonine protein kinase [Pseudomonas duriflava]|uniref:Serine/threonine protein kinase n=1 Tax=Pseudomonas duriflava TaxID=459528 RepID=A0A562QKI9_9PSED|nr:leucine-rich repeat-containing protein kinase family protein [Pseudomonas duriflava]TWI56710.1 serine/threonine protein kinase [Pseudomonas duriflava]
MDTLSQLRAGNLTGIKRLDLSCGLTEFPREIFELADSLEILNLSGNALSSLPADFGRLKKLRVLFCSDNPFSQLPEVIAECPQLRMVGFKACQIQQVPAAALSPALRWLILTNNQIEQMPETLGQCKDMQKLMLAGNRLAQLPESMIACHRLELLRISSNRFAALPDWLLTLPRLTWLAYADNPLSEAREEASVSPSAPVNRIDWHSLTLKQKLGEGASGLIYQADWQKTPEETQTVAVKLFKGSMTSDGTPQSEMAASFAIGSHPNLVDIAGQVVHHPDGTDGLVMQLIDPQFKNLAGPPSLDSCTRDVYSADTRFTLRDALSLATGIASATMHLHAAGLLHGDLYAHNILWNGRGGALLSDFGGASFLPLNNPTQSQTLQRLETRAFGCLLEELLAHCEATSDEQDAWQALAALKARCLDTDVAARPSLSEVYRDLETLSKRLG